MTITINAAYIQTRLNKTSTELPDTSAQAIANGAIDLLNVYLKTALSNLTTGTGNYTSAQAGAITTLTQMIYAKQYVNADNTNSNNIASLGVGYIFDNTLLTVAERLAYQLNRVESPPIYVANDPLPNQTY